MDVTLAQILTELYQKDQAIQTLAQKVQEQQAEIERLKAGTEPSTEGAK